MPIPLMWQNVLQRFNIIISFAMLTHLCEECAGNPKPGGDSLRQGHDCQGDSQVRGTSHLVPDTVFDPSLMLDGTDYWGVQVTD